MISVVGAVRDLVRLREISMVLVRHGFGEIVSRAGFGRTKKSPDGTAPIALPPPAPRGEGRGGGPQGSDDESLQADDAPEIPSEEIVKGEEERHKISTAERIRLVLQDLGPSFIKLGQIVSTRPDVLPADVVLELKKLQDDVPAVPFADIKKAVEASLGKPLSEAFVRFDEAPLAAASIGQVHRAVLATPEGERQVVVKVQRPGVGVTVSRDLELLHVMAAALERAIPETRIYSPIGLVQQFDRSITSELDFLVEADNAERFAKNFHDNPRVRFPKVYREASSKHVLTLEFFDGLKIDEAVARGYSGPSIAKAAVGVVVKMIFEDGFFHADPHPGNIIILGPKEEPVIGLIDVGMVGRLSPELRDRTVDLMVAAVRKDSIGVADALYAIGRPTRKVDMIEYRGYVSTLAEKYLGKPLAQIDLSSMIRDLVQGALKFGVEIPPDFMLVGKALMTIEGIGRQVDPNLDIYGTATPFFYDLLRARYSPQKIGNELWRGAMQLSRAGYDMPMQLREVLDDLRLGRLAIRAGDPEMPRAADRLGRRVFTGLVVASLTGSGALLLRDGRHEPLAVGMFVLAALAWAAHALVDLRRGPKA